MADPNSFPIGLQLYSLREQCKTDLPGMLAAVSKIGYKGVEFAGYHGRSAKESAYGCAGIFSAHAGIELYAEVFAAAGALGQLEGFASLHGADFYRLPRNETTLTLLPQPWQVPASYPFGSDVLVPLRAGERIAWRLAADDLP